MEFADYNGDSRLIEAARPVLNSVEQQFSGALMGIVLADSRGVVVRRCVGDKALAQKLDTIGGNVGIIADEKHTGTNAIATPLETRRPVFISAEEHYLECLKDFTCFGAPIISPMTRRLEGVIDLAAPVGTDAALMRIVLGNVVHDIQQRIVRNYDDVVVAQLAVFQSVNRATRDAVMLMSEDLFIQNAQALEMLSRDDYPALAELLEARGPSLQEKLQLSSGVDVRIKTRIVGHRAAVFAIRREDNPFTTSVPRGENARSTSVGVLDNGLRAATAATGHLVVMGEPGVGRSNASRIVAGDSAPRFDLADGAEVFAPLESAAAQSKTVVVEGLDLLSRETHFARLGRLMDKSTSCRIILTAGPLGSLPPHAAAIVARCVGQVTIPPLRERPGDIVRIAATMVKELGSPSSRLTLPALEALQAHPWPGNLAELRSALTDALRRRRVGDISVTDLPQRYQTKPPRRILSPLQRAERETVLRVLQENRGNKVRAAQQLRISRSTLYKRLRYFEIQ